MLKLFFWLLYALLPLGARRRRSSSGKTTGDDFVT
jgi:hypothetical protein